MSDEATQDETGGGQTVREFVLASNASVRLANCAINGPAFGRTRFAAFRKDIQGHEAAFMRTANFGRGSWNELVDLVTGAVTPPPAPFDDGTIARIEAPEDVRRRSVRSLARRHGVSSRLRNVVAANDELAALTVGDYLDDARDFRRRFAASWSVGRRTRDEIESLIRTEIADLPRRPAPPPPEPDTLTVAPDVRAMDVATLVSRHRASTRLRNSVAGDPEGRTLTIGDYVDNPWSFRKRALGFRSMGRTTMQELVDLVVAELRRPGSCIGRGVIPGTDDRHTEIQPEPQVPDEALRDWLLTEVGTLSERERDILARRYGLNARRPESLPCIARSLGISSERARQIEASALRRLREPDAVANSERLLLLSRDLIWNSIAQGEDFVADTGIPPRTGRIDPILLLACEVAHRSVREWLATWVRRDETGRWVDPTLDLDGARALAPRVAAVLRDLPIPFPLERLMDLLEVGPDLSRTVANAVPMAGTGHVVRDGYVAGQNASWFERRGADLHRVTGTLDGSVFSLHELSILQVSRDTDRSFTTKSVETAARAYPHLAGCLYDDLWFRIPLAAQVAFANVPPPEGRPVTESDDPDGTAGAWLHDLLRREGAMRVVDIRQAFHVDPAPRTFAESSISPILVSRQTFERRAYGVFALRDSPADTDHFHAIPPAAYLSDRQCLLVAHALRSETHWKLYPAWTDALAYHLCRWAIRKGTAETYRSLLHMVDVGAWDVEAKERDFWRQEKEKAGAWLLERTRPSIGTAFPRFQDVLSCLVFLSLHGAIGWMGASRAAKIAAGHGSSFDTLALLAAIGVVEPTREADAPHRATDLTGPTLKAFSRIAETGREANWESAFGRSVLDLAGSFDTSGTWIDRDALRTMLETRDRSSVAFGGDRPRADVDDVEDAPIP